MRLYRSRRNPEFAADHLVRLALHHQAQHIGADKGVLSLDSVPPGAQVICQRRTAASEIVRRIQVGGACIDEFINMSTGRLLRRVPTRCEASC